MVEIIRLDHVTNKQYGRKVLSDINLNVYKGEILGILGEFGAGRITLLKLLSGLKKKSSGKIYYEDEEVNNLTPLEAKQKGIFCIYENFSLFPNLNVIENIFVNSKLRFGWRYKKGEIYDLTRQCFDILGVNIIEPSRQVNELSHIEKCMVSVISAYISNAKLIIFDDLMPLFSDTEIVIFKRMIRHLKYKAVSVIYITNRIDNIIDFTDRTTIIRDGKTIRTVARSDYSIEKLLKIIVN